MNFKCEDPTFRSEVYSDICNLQIGAINQSYYKYGECKKNFGEGRVDALGSAEKCIDKFKKTNNAEYLIDAMNYLMFRIMFPLPGDFLQRTSSDESAGPVGVPINMDDDFNGRYAWTTSAG